MRVRLWLVVGAVACSKPEVESLCAEAEGWWLDDDTLSLYDHTLRYTHDGRLVERKRVDDDDPFLEVQYLPYSWQTSAEVRSGWSRRVTRYRWEGLRAELTVEQTVDGDVTIADGGALEYRSDGKLLRRFDADGQLLEDIEYLNSTSWKVHRVRYPTFDEEWTWRGDMAIVEKTLATPETRIMTFTPEGYELSSEVLGGERSQTSYAEDWRVREHREWDADGWQTHDWEYSWFVCP